MPRTANAGTEHHYAEKCKPSVHSEWSQAIVTPQFNKHGNKIPAASPEDLLTGDRDGSELAKVLVSPKSYDRTERMLRRKAAGHP